MTCEFSGLARYGCEPRRLGKLGAYAADDGLRAHGKSAVAQDGVELRFLHGGLEDQQRFQLCIAILLDDEYRRMRFQEGFDVAVERKRLDAQVIDADFLPAENVERLADGAVAAAETHYPDFVAPLAHHHGFGQVFR